MILLKCDHITVKNSCECQNCEPSVQRYFVSRLNIFIEKVETKKSILCAQWSYGWYYIKMCWLCPIIHGAQYDECTKRSK